MIAQVSQKELFSLDFLPQRTSKPRNYGITMIIDKGIPLTMAEGLCEMAEYIDFIKLGFGTSLIYPKIKEKIELYKSAGIIPYPGGTLYETFALYGKVDEYLKFVEKAGFDTIEISDGTKQLPLEEKCNIISQMTKRGFRVLSEVGSKDISIIIRPKKWIESIRAELQAGSFKVITEARESGTAGIHRPTGTPKKMLISLITKEIDQNNIIWEAPLKKQQEFFIKKFGPNANLGNIPVDEVLSLEALRRGLRSDTLLHFIEQKQ